MRVWIDLTNSPHVLVMRPVIEALERDGHQVQVTARDFAQTLGLLRRFQISHTAIGAHRGGRLSAKAVGMLSRSLALTRWAAKRRFDLALGHGSNDVSVAAALLRIPCSTMFDYEWAKLQHHVNCRLAQTVVVPDAIPQQTLFRYGAKGKIAAYPGLKEEYYLADFQPSEEVLRRLSLDASRPIVTVRTPPEVSLYHRFHSDLFGTVLERLSGAAQQDGLQAVVLPRTEEQRRQLRDLEGLIVPEEALDAQSLIAFSDLVVSGGGTMNREAVALGTPVCSTFAGRLGAVDERLVAEGRLTLLRDAPSLKLPKERTKQGAGGAGAAEAAQGAGAAEAAGAAQAADLARHIRRPVALLVDLLCSPSRARTA